METARQFLEQAPLVVGRASRHHDANLRVQVAGLAPGVGHPCPAAAAAGRWRSRRHLHLGLAARRVDRDVGSERGLPRGQRQFHVDVPAVQPVAGVRRDANDQVEVAGRRPAGALAALAGEADPLPVDHARAGC